MIFQYTWMKVVDGTKTQTRRLKRPGEWLNPLTRLPLPGGQEAQFTASVYRGSETEIVWQEGKFYAVQPGRGKRSVYCKYPNGSRYGDMGLIAPLTNYNAGGEDRYAHLSSKQLERDGWLKAEIFLLTLHEEDVRDIAIIDVDDEGFRSRIEFWQTWCGMHDKGACIESSQPSRTVRDYLMTRPAERYQAWVLKFMLL